MSSRLLPWVLRVAWAALPFTVGAEISEALRHHSAALRTASAVEMWAVWAVVLVATLVPHPLGLTALRCAAPAGAAAVVWAAVAGGPSTPATLVGIGWSLGVTVLTFLPSVAMLCANGPAYPNERRFLLAAPGALLIGPLELAWLAVVGMPTAAVMLLALSQWVAGVAVAVVAVPVLWILGRALHGLSLRWVVFVPAGLVIHDPISLVDPVLFVREVVESIGPAPAGSEALDLTQNAPGLALEVRLRTAVPLVVVSRQERRGRTTETDGVLFTPTRSGAVLDEAAARRLPVGSASR